MRNIVLILMLLLSGCTSKNKDIDIVFIENAEFTKDTVVNACTLIEKVNGEEATLEKNSNSYIDINGDRLSCDELNTSEVGMHRVMFNYQKQIFEVEYSVVDKEPPRIIVDEDIYLEPGEEFDIDKYIQFIDNDEVEGSVSGYLDVDLKGIYELTIQCKDKSNNYVEKKVNIHVGNSDKVISTTEKNAEEQERNQIYAERLIAQLEILEKEQNEKVEEEKKTITPEQIEEATKVYDPTCQMGEYEIEANSALGAAMIAMDLYDCWHVEVEVIPELELTPVLTPEATETPEPTEALEEKGDPTPAPESTDEPEPSLNMTPTPEPKVPKFKVKCICTVNSQKYQQNTSGDD